MSQPALCGGYLLPHPPIIIPEVGQGREREAAATVTSMQAVAGEIAALAPDTVVLLSPHAPLFSDYVYMYDAPQLAGDLGRFGAQAGVSFAQDDDLRAAIETRMGEAGIRGGALEPAVARSHGIEAGMDHGAVVPLYWLARQGVGCRLVVLSPSAMAAQRLYALGQAISAAAQALHRRVVLIASGDMSHRVNGESPYGARPEGARFDGLVVDALTRGDLPALLSIDPDLREEAGECGYRALVVLCGAYAGWRVDTKVLSYEAPFGIGYCVASFTPGPREAGENALARALAGRSKAPESPAVTMARRTVEAYVRQGRRLSAVDFPEYRDRAELFAAEAGVFVSIKEFGELRGCIGTVEPTTGSVAEEIVQNAVSAATRDPRFDPITPDELEALDINVDVLGPAEPIADAAELDPRRYGVIVERGGRRGLLLPDLPGVDTAEEQVAIACRKAGINPRERCDLFRFTVTRYR